MHRGHSFLLKGQISVALARGQLDPQLNDQHAALPNSEITRRHINIMFDKKKHLTANVSMAYVTSPEDVGASLQP